VNSPQVVFADEPTGNLDTRTSRDMMGLIISLVREHNQTLIIVTHDLNNAKYADWIVHLRDGVVEKLEKNENPITKHTENEEKINDESQEN
jgi:putative ABC transport system ATP-binding protein